MMPFLAANRTGRTKAQTLVEFALVLPILLMIIFGLLEVGRLIFIYSTVVSASREAARYGSATGWNDTQTAYHYLDCDGIRAAAENVDFLGEIDPVNGITIQYDHGPGQIPFATCPPTNPSAIVSGDRLLVTVSATFTPIVPLPLVPLQTIPITSSNARTIIGSVQLLP